MNCFHCGGEIEKGAKFCKYCGQQIDTPVKMTATSSRICMICGAKLKTGNLFCTQCGASVSENPKDSEIKRKADHHFIFSFLIFINIIILLAGIVFCWIYFFSDSSEKTADIVEYTVICVDDKGNNLSSDTYSGSIDETIIVEAPEIDGYVPKQETLSATLSSNPADNIFSFVYIEYIENAAYPDDAKEYLGHHYYIFDYDGISWNDAVHRCQELGGYPAVINDAEENAELYQYMLETNHEEAFFGLIMTDDGKWEYSLGDTSNYRDWGINSIGVEEPNNDGGNERNVQLCVHMHDGFWNDATFGRQSYTPEGKKYKNLYTYICEWDN